MSTMVPYPGLTVDGWTSASTIVADKLLSDFFLSDYSQTAMFGGDVASFAYVIQTYKTDLERICSETKTMLRKYLKKFYPIVELEVDYEARDKSINAYDLIFQLRVADVDGNEVLLQHLLTTEDGEIGKLMRIATGVEQ